MINRESVLHRPNYLVLQYRKVCYFYFFCKIVNVQFFNDFAEHFNSFRFQKFLWIFFNCLKLTSQQFDSFVFNVVLGLDKGFTVNIIYRNLMGWIFVSVSIWWCRLSSIHLIPWPVWKVKGRISQNLCLNIHVVT